MVKEAFSMHNKSIDSLDVKSKNYNTIKFIEKCVSI